MISYIKEYLPEYELHRGTEENLEDQYRVKQGNVAFFSKVQDAPVTREECRADLKACPPDFPKERQNYWLVYEKRECIAILAYLEGYPDAETVYIGLLMVDAKRQKNGIGQKLNQACVRAAFQSGYRNIRLGCYRANENGYRFWQKNGYCVEKETEIEENGTKRSLLHMVRNLSDCVATGAKSD